VGSRGTRGCRVSAGRTGWGVAPTRHNCDVEVAKELVLHGGRIDHPVTSALGIPNELVLRVHYPHN
jgi:hypothetical protein